MRGRRIKIGGALAIVLVLLLGGAYALADEVISTAPVGLAYSKSSFTITGGQVATFSNAQGLGHSVASDDTKTLGGKALFGSATIGSGSAAVKGTQFLAPGDYAFHCSVHGPSMSATLHVDGGTAIARPHLTLLITSGKLAKVQDSGKLKVRVSDEGSDANGVTLTAKRGSKVLSTTKGVKVAADDAVPVTMKLSKAGKAALKGLDQATVKLSGTVDFGLSAKTKRTLK